MKKKYKPWRLISAKPSDKVVTRDGREVLKWEVVKDPKESLWATQITTKDPADKRKRVTYLVNHNGRRYTNIQSSDDIVIEVPVKERGEELTGCMPDPILAIKAIKEGNMAGVRSANKGSGYLRRDNMGDSYYLGTNSDE